MYIAVDIGGTNMRIALADVSNGARLVRVENQPVPQDYPSGIRLLTDTIQKLAEGTTIEGIGACFPGIIDRNGMITTANNLPDWTMKPIRQTLEERIGVPVRIVHDAQAPALGEALFGAARDVDRFVYFIWGTGIGAADIKKIDEKTYFMFSFENGHHILDWEGKVCNCGQRGCPEAILGGDMLEVYFGEDIRGVADDDPRWDFIVEKAAHTVLNTFIFHPVGLMVFNGGVIRNRPFMLERMRPIIRKQMKMFRLPRMVLAEKGDQAALFGCAGIFGIELI